MGWMDGAVNAMVSRIVGGGYTFEQATCLAQAAYLKKNKFSPGVPSPVLKRSEISWEINQALKGPLNPFTPAAEANRQRRLLWERVFGTGTWARWSEVEQSRKQVTPSPALAHSPMIDGTTRYFDTVDLAFMGDRITVPAMLFEFRGSELSQWLGAIVAWDGMIGFFEESDWLAEDMADGTPLLHQLADLRELLVQTPERYSRPPGLNLIDFRGSATQFLFRMTFDDGSEMQLRVAFDGLSSASQAVAAEAVDRLLQISQKAMAMRKG